MLTKQISTETQTYIKIKGKKMDKNVINVLNINNNQIAVCIKIQENLKSLLLNSLIELLPSDIYLSMMLQGMTNIDGFLSNYKEERQTTDEGLNIITDAICEDFKLNSIPVLKTLTLSMITNKENKESLERFCRALSLDIGNPLFYSIEDEFTSKNYVNNEALGWEVASSKYGSSSLDFKNIESFLRDAPKRYEEFIINLTIFKQNKDDIYKAYTKERLKRSFFLGDEEYLSSLEFALKHPKGAFFDIEVACLVKNKKQLDLGTQLDLFMIHETPSFEYIASKFPLQLDIEQFQKDKKNRNLLTEIGTVNFFNVINLMQPSRQTFDTDLLLTNKQTIGEYKLQNTLIIGGPGSGMMMLLRSMQFSAFTKGKKVITIEQDTTYSPQLNKKCGGQLLEINMNLDMSFNPFSLLSNNQLNTFELCEDLTTLLMTLITNDVFKPSFEHSIRLNNAIQSAWSLYGDKLEVSHIRDYFISIYSLTDEVIPMLLRPFCHGGIYESFFAGENEFKIENSFTTIGLNPNSQEFYGVMSPLLLFHFKYLLKTPADKEVVTHIMFEDSRVHYDKKNLKLFDNLYNAAARHNGNVTYTIQSLVDSGIYNAKKNELKKFGKLIVGHSLNRVIMQQQAPMISGYMQSNYLGIPSHLLSELMSIHTQRAYDVYGGYADLLCRNNYKWSVLKLKADKFAEVFYPKKEK